VAVETAILASQGLCSYPDQHPAKLGISISAMPPSSHLAAVAFTVMPPDRGGVTRRINGTLVQ
jgi:hypothetical protein